MSDEVKDAVCDWVAGFMIGIIPIFAHGLAHVLFDPAKDYDETWSPDILLIAIATSGLSIVTIITKIDKGRRVRVDRITRILLAVTLLCLIAAVFEYGGFVMGNTRHYPVVSSLIILFAASVCSLYFEMALARP